MTERNAPPIVLARAIIMAKINCILVARPKTWFIMVRKRMPKDAADRM